MEGLKRNLEEELAPSSIPPTLSLTEPIKVVELMKRLTDGLLKELMKKCKRYVRANHLGNWI